MANYCFFTDSDKSGRLIAQNSSNAFGVVSDAEFRVTSLHIAAATPRVFAICDGKLAAQQDSQSNVISLILQPKNQPGGVGNKINFVSIKYIIYKGVLKDSLISGSSIADRSKNQLTRRAHDTQDIINRAMELLLDLPAQSLTLTPSSALLGYDIAGSDSESLDKLFYKPDKSAFEHLSVAAGDYIGDFDKNLFGIEIVLDDVRANANFALTKHIETKLQAPLPTASNPSQLFKRRHQKEAAISFMDPCAFFGSFFQHGGIVDRPAKLRYRLSTDIIDVEKETKDSDLRKANGTEIYDDILRHFFNKNAVYIDIRNELNTSINFYQHYDNNIKLTIPQADNEVIDKDYYGNGGWPLLVLRPNDYDLHNQNNDSSKDAIKIEISLPNPSGENVSPLVYISQGYIKKIKRNKVLRGEKRYVPLTTSDDYTEPFSVVVPNIASESVITPVSQYIRIKYLKSVLKGASSGIVPRASNYLDLLFLPFRMRIPFAVTANSKSRIYQEDAFLSLSEESGCESAGAVGIAEDTKNITFFAYAGDKLRTTGTTRLRTISIPSEVATESHYLNLVRDRYHREKLFQGTLNLGSVSNPIYLKFADGDPTADKGLNYANLSDEFIAIVIDKLSFAKMRLADTGFSDHYDVFVRLENEESKTADGIDYTTYDVVLEGYVDKGTSISLNTFSAFDPKIKVYSFGKDHNLVLVDSKATYDSATPFDELPSCTGAFSQDELGHLKKFIDKIDETPGPPPPFDDLWTKVFDLPGRIRVNGGPPPDGPPYELKNLVSPSDLPKGFLAEACTIFTLYKFQQQLVVDTKQDTDVDATDKSTIYKALKEILITAGFKKPATGSDTLKFNQMMDPDRHIGDRGKDFLDELPDPAIHAEPVKRVMYDLMKIGNLEGGDRKFVFPNGVVNETDILRKIDSILTDYGRKIAFLVREDSSCAFKILLPNAKSPDNLFLASGDGSPTSGLFNAFGLKSGVLLFNYGYDGLAGVNKQAIRNFPSADPALSTVVHLTLFGTNHPGDPHSVPPDNGDSSVKVTKDKIACVFKANGNNKVIRPVSGSLAGEASYDATTRLFSYGGHPVASYNPDQRDLMFIDIGKKFSFDVTLISHHDPGSHLTLPDDDEISVSINVVQGPKLHIFEFEAEDLFDNDVFVVTGNKKVEFEAALLRDPKDVAAIDFMIDRLINFPTIPISISLRGNFVGKELKPPHPQTHSKVEPDTTYQFFFTRPEGREKETDQDPASYKPLRYSFGSVAITDFEIIITIDSFVSPLWSRLDNKIFQLPLSLSEQVAKKAELDNLTNYYTIAGSDAYVDHVGGDPRPTNATHPNLPSYNPILSCLRSFGLAVALNDFLSVRATAQGHDPFDMKLLDKIKDAKILKNELLGIGSDIEFKHYGDFQ